MGHAACMWKGEKHILVFVEKSKAVSLHFIKARRGVELFHQSFVTAMLLEANG